MLLRYRYTCSDLNNLLSGFRVLPTLAYSVYIYTKIHQEWDVKRKRKDTKKSFLIHLWQCPATSSFWPIDNLQLNWTGKISLLWPDTEAKVMHHFRIPLFRFHKDGIMRWDDLHLIIYTKYVIRYLYVYRYILLFNYSFVYRNIIHSSVILSIIDRIWWQDIK